MKSFNSIATFAALSIILLISSSCGNETSKKLEVSSDSSLLPSSTPSNLICKLPNKSFEGCCANHNGIRNCSLGGGHYFASNGYLLCNDGSLSETCSY